MIGLIHFASPWWFTAAPVILALAWWRAHRSRLAALKISSVRVLGTPAGSTRVPPGRWLAASRTAALILVTIALARPQIEKSETREDTRGINLMLTLDFSGSMNSLDFFADGRRMTRSKGLKRISAEFIRSRPNDRIGLVTFDRDAGLVCPLTLDHDWLLARLHAELNGIGTGIGPALIVAGTHLQRYTNETRVIILMTDAENLTGWPEPDEVAETLQPLGIRVYCVQILSPDRSAPSNDLGELLTHTAALTGGTFFRVRSGSDLRSVYTAIDKLERRKLTDRKEKAWRELFPWTALPALALLLFEQAMAHTRWRRLP